MPQECGLHGIRTRFCRLEYGDKVTKQTGAGEDNHQNTRGITYQIDCESYRTVEVLRDDLTVGQLIATVHQHDLAVIFDGDLVQLCYYLCNLCIFFCPFRNGLVLCCAVYFRRRAAFSQPSPITSCRYDFVLAHAMSCRKRDRVLTCFILVGTNT